MTLIAKGWLRQFEKVFRVLPRVDAMASHAADIAVAVAGLLEVGMLALVTAEALRVNFLSGCLGGIEDLGYIPAAIYVGLPGAMAVFAGHALLAMHLGHLGVRIRSELVGYLLVTSGAGVRPHKLRSGWLCSSLLACGLRARSRQPGHRARGQDQRSNEQG